MRAVVAAVLVAAALLAGCGGGSDEPKIVSKDLYIAEADNVCASLSERFNSAGAADPQTPRQIVDSAKVLSDLYGDLLKGLRDVKLPARPADRRGAAAYVGAVAHTSSLLVQVRSSANAFLAAVAVKDAAKLTQTGNDVRQALDDFRAAQAGANARAVAYGFNLCGNLH
ncbi:MAG: hypothetical protein QOE11_2970 [Solirubrobacteraceae bacterium]|nr:hypothetical protein [Solirubrobacteraceae bacterium]